MTLRAGLLLVAVALVQVTLIGRIDPAIPEPNLLLALVAARAFLAGGRAGMAWGLAAGLLLDLAATGPLGVHALAMLGAAYVSGLLASAFENAWPPLAALGGAAASIVYSLVVLGAADSLGLAEVSLGAQAPLIAGGAAVAAALTVAAAALLQVRRPAAAP